MTVESETASGSSTTASSERGLTGRSVDSLRLALASFSNAGKSVVKLK